MNYISSNKRGSATIFTLLISAVVITVGIGFNWMVKEHLKAAQALKDKSEAMLRARSAYDTLMYSVLNGRITSKEVDLTGGDITGVTSIPLDGKVVSLGGDIRVSVQDSNGMVSLVTTNDAVLERLVGLFSPDSDRPAEIMDSLLDWKDRDDFSRTNGAEKSYYETEGKPYVARNYLPQYKEELDFIRGMDGALYKKLSPFLTILPNTGFNPNTASDDVLKAYLDIDQDTLASIRSYMEKTPVTSDAELFAITGRRIVYDMDRVYFFPSLSWEITVYAGSPKTIYSIKAGVELQQSEVPYSIVYWKEG